MTRENILDMVDEGVLDASDAANAGLQYLSTDDVDDLLRVNGWDDDFEGEDIYDLLDEGVLDPNDVLNAVLQYLSTDDVADLARMNGWDEDDEDEEEEEEYYFDPDEMKARAKDAIAKWDGKRHGDEY